MSFTQVPPNSTGNKIDCVQLIDGADTVQRQVVTIGDPTVVGRILGVNNDGSINAVVAGVVAVSNFPATQAVTGTVTANTGLAQPLTDAQLRASAVPVSMASSPLPSGAATEATLSSLNAKFGAIGQQLMASSSPVAIASNQSAFPVSNNDGVRSTGSIAALNGDILAATDCTKFRAISVQLSGTFVGTVQVQVSNDANAPTNWAALNVVAATGGISSNMTSVNFFVTDLRGAKWVRVRVTAYTSGTIVGDVHLTEQVTGMGRVDIQSIIAALPTGANTIGNVNLNTSTAIIGAAADIAPVFRADVASAAITSTATTASFTPSYASAYKIVIPVTLVSGTTPTMDIVVQESDDSGTNWFDVYHFPRITATGFYRSPPILLRGNRVRYAQTIGGTTPSFTRAISRLEMNDQAAQFVQFIDRTIAPNTLNSVTPAFYIEGCVDFNVSVRCTAQTTAATIVLQVSDDGANWFNTTLSIATIAGLAAGKIQNENWKFGRLIVTAAGTGITLAEVVIKGVGR